MRRGPPHVPPLIGLGGSPKTTKDLKSPVSRLTSNNGNNKRSYSESPFMVYIVTLVLVACSIGLLSSFYLTAQLDQHDITAVAATGGAGNHHDPTTVHNAAAAAAAVAVQSQQETRKKKNVIPPKAATPTAIPFTTTPSLFTTVAAVRAEFDRRYGASAEGMKQDGLQQFGSVTDTAKRMITAAANRRPFVMAFAGYSVTVGRGNHLEQSFPFVLQRILEPVLKHSTLQIPSITTRNAAIGGIPSFPYGFCFEHFLGRDADVISWDYSMNEGQGAAVLESYLRQSQHQLPNRPMLILLDTNKRRCKTLQTYTNQGLLADALCVGMAKNVLDQELLDQLNESGYDDSQQPAGLQHWQEFGAPPQCPGRGSWHPKRMEHEFIGWIMALYFVQAVEEAQHILLSDPNWQLTYQDWTFQPRSLIPPSEAAALSMNETAVFPETLHDPPENDLAVTELLYGHAVPIGDRNNKSVYAMKQLSCRTNFMPAVDLDKVLPSVVVSGLAPGVTAENIMEVRSDAAYRSGWVLDVSKVERETKVKVERCGGLGYVDMKIALYGVPESGPLRLWLPLEGDRMDHHQEHDHGDDLTAKHWFDELIICEANEKRPPAACQLDSDLEYTVGGVVVESTKMIAGAGEYLKRKTCVHVGVPADAQITKLGNVQATDGSAISRETRIRLAGSDDAHDDQVGLVVDVKARGKISRDKGACCLSHIVWEQH